jgi:hypothetical protein
VVLTDGVSLRPGPTTWWYPRQTLPEGTELKLLGYNPDYPDWVYVGTLDDEDEEKDDVETNGWAPIADLEINRVLEDLPLMTPIPTRTP